MFYRIKTWRILVFADSTGRLCSLFLWQRTLQQQWESGSVQPLWRHACWWGWPVTENIHTLNTEIYLKIVMYTGNSIISLWKMSRCVDTVTATPPCAAATSSVGSVGEAPASAYSQELDKTDQINSDLEQNINPNDNRLCYRSLFRYTDLPSQRHRPRGSGGEVRPLLWPRVKGDLQSRPKIWSYNISGKAGQRGKPFIEDTWEKSF